MRSRTRRTGAGTLNNATNANDTHQTTDTNEKGTDHETRKEKAIDTGNDLAHETENENAGEGDG